MTSRDFSPSEGEAPDPSLSGRADLGGIAAGALVHTPSGLRPIESIQVGDMVLAHDADEHAHRATWFRRVVEARHRPDTAILDLHVTHDHFGTRIIRLTPEHRVFAGNNGWIPASEIDADTGLCIDASGCALRVGAAYDGKLHTVHTLTLDKDDTLFVGECGVWVRSA